MPVIDQAAAQLSSHGLSLMLWVVGNSLPIKRQGLTMAKLINSREDRAKGEDCFRR